MSRREGQERIRLRRAIEVQLGALERADPPPHGHLDPWREMLRGHWAFVDRLALGGHHHLVARRNGTREIESAAFTPREKEIASHLARGESNKCIGYHIGIGTSSVAFHLASMRRKLGIVTRIDLVHVLAAVAQSLDTHKVTSTEQATRARPWPLEFENTDYIVVKLPSPASNLMERLTKAERAVCHLKIMGCSNGAIAKQRGVSLSTVVNQVASIFRKLAVSSRSELAALASAEVGDPLPENLDVTK